MKRTALISLASINRAHMASTHTDKDIAFTIEAARRVLAKLT